MKENFDVSLKRVLVHEGGLVDNPKDPGGRTFQGVTQRVYAAWCSRRGRPIQDVSRMLPEERDAIYRAQFWAPIRGDDLPAGLDGVVFDGAVNSGVSQSVKWLQRALGVAPDGQLGQITLDALETHPDVDKLIADVCQRRLLFCRALSTWRYFGKGWSARIDAVRVAGQAQAVGSVGPAPVYVNYGERKASLSDAKKAPQTIAADAGRAAGFRSRRW
jgi:lysozyme family protein